MEATRDRIMEAAKNLRETECGLQLIADLDNFARHKYQLDYAEQALALATIIAAEQIGLITGDEYNGYMETRIENEVLIFDTASHLDCEPVRIDMSNGVGTGHAR